MWRLLPCILRSNRIILRALYSGFIAENIFLVSYISSLAEIVENMSWLGLVKSFLESEKSILVGHNGRGERAKSKEQRGERSKCPAKRGVVLKVIKVFLELELTEKTVSVKLVGAWLREQPCVPELYSYRPTYIKPSCSLQFKHLNRSQLGAV